MVYEITRILCRAGIPVYFRSYYLRNMNRVPHEKPLMICANHPNAFMDPMVLGYKIPRQLYFLVRSDVFNTPFKKWILGEMNQIPIYRIEEGADQLHKNEETFRTCEKLFEQKKAILIFIEGLCIHEKRLRKLKKGAARIAFGSEEKSGFTLDLHLQPVGINYSEGSRFHRDVVVDYGHAFSINEFIDLYKADKTKAIVAFNKKIDEELRKLMIIIDDPKNDELNEQLEVLIFNNDRELFNDRERKYLRRKHLASEINRVNVETPQVLEELKGLLTKYFSGLDKNDIYDRNLHEVSENKGKAGSILYLIILSPIFLFGLINNYLPFILPYKIAGRIVKKKEFFSSINLGSALFIYLIWYILVIIISSCIADSIISGIIYTASAILSGFIAMSWYRKLKDVQGFFRAKSLNKNTGNDLLNQRLLIVEKIKAGFNSVIK